MIVLHDSLQRLIQMCECVQRVPATGSG